MSSDDKPSLTWREKFLRNWMHTRLAHEGMMLDKIGQQTKRALAVADMARTGNFAAAPDGEEDMGVSIGNEVHYHPSPGASALGKLAVGASLLAGGAGAGVVANQLMRDDAPPQPPAVVAQEIPISPDRDTLTDVTFPE